jgi:hypothetical protein
MGKDYASDASETCMLSTLGFTYVALKYYYMNGSIRASIKGKHFLDAVTVAFSRQELHLYPLLSSSAADHAFDMSIFWACDRQNNA